MLADVRKRARSYFGDVALSHDWHHVERVERLAVTLAESYDVDTRILRVAALLHDIGRGREDRGEIDDHAEWGATEAGKILEGLGVSDGAITRVQQCIHSHRYSNEIEPASIEAELLCDADNLDALGAVGLARCFCYGGELGQPIYDPDFPASVDDSSAGRTQVNHLRKKILLLPERMYTDEGRRLAEKRRAFVADFVDRVEREAAGDA
ncbi:HD domain-containing protein [Halegenticoccus soli]|uniref:HD domain-containing protein n=1 Tax=Halegenticoccus soli TaxID=1985678 RepID=UPI000C6DA6BA|nr:HD domain-containing protein [Halegenticoccus soli]